MESDRTPSDGTDELVVVRFPELPVSSYLRCIAWWYDANAVLLAEPSLEAVAHANGVSVLDPRVQRTVQMLTALIASEAAEAVELGSRSMAPAAQATLRQWSEGLSLGDRLTAWIDRLSGSALERIPQPSDEVRHVREEVAGAIRRRFDERVG